MSNKQGVGVGTESGPQRSPALNPVVFRGEIRLYYNCY